MVAPVADSKEKGRLLSGREGARAKQFTLLLQALTLEGLVLAEILRYIPRGPLTRADAVVHLPDLSKNDTNTATLFDDCAGHGEAEVFAGGASEGP